MYSVLGKISDHVRKIHEAALGILERTGLEVQDQKLLRRCGELGAPVDEPAGRVRFPLALAEELLGQIPRSYTVAAIDGQTYKIGDGTIHSLAISNDPCVIDYESQQPRPPKLEDIRRHTIIGQQLGHVYAMSCMEFPVADQPEEVAILKAWEAHLLLNARHYMFAPTGQESVALWEQLLETADTLHKADQPCFSVMVSVRSPLTMTPFNIDLLRFAARHGAPVVPTSCPMAGSTGPYSIAGTLLMAHVEVLGMALLSQAVQPGHPFLYSVGPSVMDLGSGHDLYYTPDKALWRIACGPLGRLAGLPVNSECGGTMGPSYDVQSGMEGFALMQAAVDTEPDCISGFGSCYTAMGISAEHMLIQDAWRECALFLLKGLDVSGGRLGVESIEAAGPGGNFLTDELTLSHMGGDEFFHHDLMSRLPYGVSGPSMLDRAHERVEELTSAFESTVPHAVQEAISRFFHDKCNRAPVG
jgi:trimethylamine--corrinoid protein Co-methyltransferase